MQPLIDLIIGEGLPCLLIINGAIQSAKHGSCSLRSCCADVPIFFPAQHNNFETTQGTADDMRHRHKSLHSWYLASTPKQSR